MDQQKKENQPAEMIIRVAKPEQMMIFVDWSVHENWNPSTYDAQYFYLADPQGFFVGEVNNQIMATVSAVAYSQGIGFIGYLMVKPAFRKKGYGKQMFNHAMKRLEGMNIGLQGVPHMISHYKEKGFKQYYKTYTMQCKSIDKAPKDQNIVKLSQIPFQKLQQYDHKVCPFPRSALLSQYIKIPEGEAVGYYQNGQLKGYGIIKKSTLNKYRISPLYADNQQIAQKLLDTLRAHPKQYLPVLISPQDVNQKGIKLCEKNEMKEVFWSARMYTKQLPSIQYGKIYGILSGDLG